MSESENKNIIKFSNRSQIKSNQDRQAVIKNFAGFDYVKMEQDLNGTPFVKESLIEYACGCRYMVRVVREKESKTLLYNYYIPQDKLGYFLTKIESGEFDGQIIDVEKYIPEDLA